MEQSITVVGANGLTQTLYTPTEKQLEYHGCVQPNVLFWGGRGSGKSMCGRWDAHIRALSHPGFTYCILRRTYPELQRSHLVHIATEMKLLGGYYNHSEKCAYYPNGSRGFFSQCNGDEDVLKLLSAEFALMFFDELSTFEWEHFTKLSASVRVKQNSGLIAMVRAATNPLGPSAGEVMKYFVNKDVDPEEEPDYVAEEWHSIHANVEDNPHLDRTQYQKRFAGLPAHVRKAWVDGEFIMENALFDFHPKKTITNEEGLKVEIPYHVVDRLDMDKIIKNGAVYRAIDAGWFPDPTVVLWIANLGNRHVVLREEVQYRKTALEMAEIIKAVDVELGLREPGSRYSKVGMTYCDPTMDIHTTADVKTVKELYELAGIPMENSINNREMFATIMHQYLSEEAIPNVPKLQIYSRGCPYLIRTLPMQHYDQKHPEKMADHKHDHGVITCAYYLMSHSSDDRHGLTPETQLKKWMKPKQTEKWVLGHESVKRFHR